MGIYILSIVSIGLGGIVVAMFLANLIQERGRFWRMSCLAPVALICAVGLIGVGLRHYPEARLAAFGPRVDPHAGHEALHAQIKAELFSAKYGDLLILDGKEEEPKVFIAIGEGDQVVRFEDAIYPSRSFMDSAGREYVDRVVKKHIRVVSRNSPEYDKILGAAFRKFYAPRK